MGQINEQPSLLNIIKDLKARVQALANTQAIPIYTVATRPTATTPQIIFVSDAASGSRYQGWDTTGATWVPLG